MAYDLRIERLAGSPDTDPTPILLGEWSAAVAATEGVRLFAADAHTITNPKTGEVISIPIRQGDAEVFFPDTGQWHSVFRWRGGSAAFTGRFDPGDSSHPVWAIAIALASRVGDEGEIYDLQTGEIVDG